MSAVEIQGTVRSATEKEAIIVTDSELMPIPGDKVAIFFKLAGADDEISVASGHVVEIGAESIKVELENASGSVAKDHLARITSEKPQKRNAPSTARLGTPQSHPPPPLSPTPTSTPKKESGTTAEEPPDVGQMASRTVTFDTLASGPLSSHAFIQHGVRLTQSKGRAEIYDAQPNMLLPPPCKKVMLVGGGPVTSFTIQLDPAVKRFAVYRIGTAKGASTPTWQMTAYDNNGKVLGRVGEERGLPLSAKYFGVDAAGITRVELTSDNRYGTGTWATWNSLPVAGFGFDR